MTFKYEVDEDFAKQYPDAVANIDDVSVLLSGVDREFDIPGTDQVPPSKRKIKVATQKQLEFLKEKCGNPHINKVAV